MRVYDAQFAVYDGLCALEQYRYLRAMWMIGRELRGIYEDRTVGPERSLIEATLDLVRAAAVCENVPAELVKQARGLDAEWERLIDDPGDTVLSGQWNMWMVFGMLACEISGGCDTHLAAERVPLALTRGYREQPGPGRRRRARAVDFAEEIGDDSPMALALTRAQLIITAVVQMSAAVRDPAAVREELLGP